MANYGLIEVLDQETLNHYESQNETVYGGHEFRIVPLGVRSTKALVILNKALFNKYENRPERTGRYNYGGKKGGGLLCKGQAHYAIDSMNQVYVVFANRSSVTDYCRAATNRNEIIASIKDKIANSLKEWFDDVDSRNVWSTAVAARHSNNYNTYSGNYGAFSIIQPEEGQNVEKNSEGYPIFQISVSRDEYRCLYEFLKGRDIDKIKAKYGKDVYERIIGTQINDQFLLSALEVIKNEINNTILERNARLEQIDKDYTERYNKMMAEKKNTKDNVSAEAAKKIDDLNKQMAEMMATAAVAADVAD